MTFQHFIRLFTLEPVKLTVKGKLLAVIFCFTALGVTGFICQVFSFDNEPLLVASMGASAVILFVLPNSPFAQPWPFAGGQLLSALAGITCAKMIPDVLYASTAAMGLSALLMLTLRCVHPPGAATALAPVLGGQSIQALGYAYAWTPVGINILAMLSMAIIINRWLMKHDYPLLAKAENKKTFLPQPVSNNLHTIGISEQDILQVLEKTDVFLDITASELSHILTATELHYFKRLSKEITCLDIMQRDVISVEYGTEVEEAWKLMQHYDLKALVVIDRARRVIGIVTWHDFLKFVELQPQQHFSQRLRSFIRRTPDVTTNKPEAIGHIMTSAVTACQESLHLVDLAALMLNTGHRQIPVINTEQRLVGIVYQNQLIAALYQQQLAFYKNQTVNNIS